MNQRKETRRTRTILENRVRIGVVACVIAALWAMDPSVFWRPCVDGAAATDGVALLEGWLYAPVNL